MVHHIQVKISHINSTQRDHDRPAMHRQRRQYESSKSDVRHCHKVSPNNMTPLCSYLVHDHINCAGVSSQQLSVPCLRAYQFQIT